MNFTSTIRGKLLFTFMIFGILPILVGGVSLYLVLENYLTNRTFEELSTFRDLKAAHLEFFFRDRMREVEFVAQSKDALDELNPKSSFYNFILAKSIYYPLDGFAKELSFLEATHYYEDFSITDGKTVVSGKFDKISDLNIIRLLGSAYESLWIRTSIWRKTVMQDFRIEGKKNKIYISSPIIKNNRVAGMLTLGIGQDKIDDLIFGGKESAFGRTGDIFLVGRDYLLRTKSKFSEKKILKERFNPKIVMNVFANSQLNFKTNNLRKDAIFVSAEHLDIPFLNWALFVTINKSEALQSLSDVRYSFILILILFAFGIYLFASYTSKKISSPIVKLKEAASVVEEGEFGVNIEENEKNEIGELVSAFNKMAATLRERTKELKEREERLFHFYSATSDGILLFDDNKPVLVNRALARLTGYSKEELMNKRVDRLLSGHKTKLTRSEDTITYETLIREKSGKLFPAEIQERKVEYRGKLIDACVMRDITKRREIEKELEQIKKSHLTSIYDEIEKERQRLARELHDGLGQALVAVQLQIQQAIETSDRDELNVQIENIIENLDTAIDEIRSISNGLRPAVLNEFGLSNALQKLCSDLDKHSGINFIYDGDVLKHQLDIRTTSYLYRIAQEALNNVVKYSNAKEAKVTLRESDYEIKLTIKDDGIGFNKDEVIYGNGLRNMTERVKIIHGNFVLFAEKGKGVEIVVSVMTTT
jgi:two-component system sensor histidine kinase NreB